MEETKVEKFIDDAAITTKVKSKLLADSRVSSLKIEVTTKNRIVKLSGEADSEEALYAVIETAYSTAGVEDVDVSDLKVKPASQHPIDDSIITAKIKGLFLREKIFGDKPVNLFGIKVETRNGIVYLSGSANKEQAENAVRLAKTIKGVKEIKNEISIS